MRIGFLFNHDQIHQVAHSLPIALALARRYPQITVVLAVGTGSLREEVERLAAGDLGRSNLAIERLHPGGPGRRLTGWTTRWAVPSEKVLLLGANLPFFASLDALVVTEKTSLLLRRRHGLTDLRLIHTRHGAGDRAIGFDRASAEFDLVLVSGDKIAQRLVTEAGVMPERIRIVGYPKFDLPPGRFPAEIDGGDPRPLVLYNPHASPALSSWYRLGPAVLDWFVRHPSYRLIFAPHVSLFARKIAVSVAPPGVGVPGRVPATVRHAPNIHIDLGSIRSTDRSYTEAADIYLGDVSSQVYEFLRRPRPCVFLDAHATAWAGSPDYLHWSAGEVVREVAGLEEALARAASLHRERYLARQRDLLDRTFSVASMSASDRAATAIAGLLAPGLTAT